MGDALRRRIKQERFESPLQEAVLNLVVAAAHVQELFGKVCAEFGISGGQYNVLRILRGVHPGGHSRCDIASRLLDRAPDVTRILDRLERQGLVERAKSDSDRRLSISRLTREGVEMVDRMEPAVRAVNEQLADRISLRDRHELSRICEGIYDDEL